MSPNIRKSVASILAACSVGFAGSASGAVDFFLLPTPGNNPYATYQQRPDAEGVLRDAIVINNVVVAYKYDDFWSYSANLLEKMQTVGGQSGNTQYLAPATFGAYDFSTGTGTIDVNLTSVAGGATNVVKLSDGTKVYMQDPVDLASSSTIQGWTGSWGGDPQTFSNQKTDGTVDKTYSRAASDVGGTTTVGELLAYLQDIDPTWTVPVLYADYNQTGAGDSLWFSAKVEIINPLTGLPVASWQLDGTQNDIWNQTDPTFNFGQIGFYGSKEECLAAGLYNPVTGKGCAGWTADGVKYLSIDHNLGSGHSDFMVYAPDMDLSAYNSNSLFVVTANLGCLQGITQPWPVTTSVGCNTNGGEEFGVFGGVGPTRVSEPGSLALLGIAMGLLGWRGRRQRK